MVSLFGLDRVIPYKSKKGRDFESLSFAFGTLMDHMETTLGGVLKLERSPHWLELRALAHAATRKSDLGRIEDEVDAVFCAYLAWLWVNDPTVMQVYGDLAFGYIVSPPPPVVPPRRGATKAGATRAEERSVSLAAELRRTNPRLSQQEADELAAVAAVYYGNRR
jgi:predicted RNase H-like nuclease